jgi:tryptophan synthase beta chain
MIQTWGVEVVASPSQDTEAGRKILLENPDSNGSLGIAVSEAVEDAVTNDNSRYSLGSFLNHVLLHQTIIGLEAKKQMKLTGDFPDTVIGCVGGGSNFAGLSFPFLYDKISGKDIRFLAVEPAACPTLTRGPFAYDFVDTAKLTPLVAMYTLGHKFVPPGIHAGGLRYHGASPAISQLIRDGLIEAKAYHQLEVFEAAVQFARNETIIPAPESSHAIKAAIDEAILAKQEGRERVILFNLSGHGHFDMAAYNAYFDNELVNHSLHQSEIDAALEQIKGFPKLS